MRRRIPLADWTPNPECEKAFAHALETAHLCAAAMWGERPSDKPERDASARALMLSGAMIYFLFRLDPDHLRALVTGPGSMEEWSYKPFPPGFALRKGIFAQMLD